MFGEGLWLRHFVAALVVSGRLVWSGLSLGNFSFKHTHTHTEARTLDRCSYQYYKISRPLSCASRLVSLHLPPCSMLCFRSNRHRVRC
uniref:Putative secreted protein n=1 Tax=Anopheles darlingi TaxID=43151 RepID=A0A2M4D8D2_ANODA